MVPLVSALALPAVLLVNVIVPSPQVVVATLKMLTPALAASVEERLPKTRSLAEPIVPIEPRSNLTKLSRLKPGVLFFTWRSAALPKLALALDPSFTYDAAVAVRVVLVGGGVWLNVIFCTA